MPLIFAGAKIAGHGYIVNFILVLPAHPWKIRFYAHSWRNELHITHALVENAISRQ
jgi:hypothetical protein